MRKNNVDLRNEHETVRNRVGFYDFTHQLVVATGSSAAAFLDKVFANSIGKTKPGDAIYTQMLNEDANIIDDIVVFRIDKETFWISTLYAEEMIKWFDSQSSGYDVNYADKAETTIMYAVQGPNSADVLNDFLEESIDELKVFSIKENKVDGVDVRIARCGFTGELGYEIYLAPEHRDLVVSKLLKSGERFDIAELKTDVILSSLPTEKGYILMRDIAGTNPLESGFGWAVDWNKGFIGKSALERAKSEGVTRSLVGFTVENDAAEIAEGAEVRVNGKSAGKVTNFTYGFTVEKNIGYALIDTTIAQIGDTATIVSGNREIEATLTRRSFYDLKDARRRGKVTV